MPTKTQQPKHHVLHVTEPGKDGVFRYVETLLREQMTMGFKVSLAYSSARSCQALFDLVKQVKEAGGWTLDMETSNMPKLRDFPIMLRLRRAISEQGITVVHAHSSKAGALSRLAIKGIPVFYTPNAYYGLGNSDLKAWLFNRVERRLAKCGHSIHVSPNELAFAREKLGYKGPATVIPNPVDTQLFRPPTKRQREQARKLFGLDPERPVIGTMGRLEYQKNVHLLYEAFAEAVQANPKLQLLHVGDGSELSHARQQIADLGLGKHITAVPFLSDATAFYWACNVFTLTSRYEGLSFASLEALATGLPLVITKVPGNLGLIQSDFDAVFGVNPCPTCIVHGWEKALSVPSNNHVKQVTRHYGPKAIAERVNALY